MNTFSTARSLAYFAVAMTIATQSTDAQDRSQGRSMVISRNGIVAAESPLAAQTGAKILERGGDGVDAAIATDAMMGVVEAVMDGVGGDLFGIGYDARGRKFNGTNRGGGGQRGLKCGMWRKKGSGG